MVLRGCSWKVCLTWVFRGKKGSEKGSEKGLSRSHSEGRNTPFRRARLPSHAPPENLWTGKSSFSDHALVKAIFEASTCLQKTLCQARLCLGSFTTCCGRQLSGPRTPMLWIPVSPIPPKLGVSDTPPPKFRGWIGTRKILGVWVYRGSSLQLTIAVDMYHPTREAAMQAAVSLGVLAAALLAAATLRWACCMGACEVKKHCFEASRLVSTN